MYVLPIIFNPKKVSSFKVSINCGGCTRTPETEYEETSNPELKKLLVTIADGHFNYNKSGHQRGVSLPIPFKRNKKNIRLVEEERSYHYEAVSMGGRLWLYIPYGAKEPADVKATLATSCKRVSYVKYFGAPVFDFVPPSNVERLNISGINLFMNSRTWIKVDDNEFDEEIAGEDVARLMRKLSIEGVASIREGVKLHDYLLSVCHEHGRNAFSSLTHLTILNGADLNIFLKYFDINHLKELTILNTEADSYSRCTAPRLEVEHLVMSVHEPHVFNGVSRVTFNSILMRDQPSVEYTDDDTIKGITYLSHESFMTEGRNALRMNIMDLRYLVERPITRFKLTLNRNDDYIVQRESGAEDVQLSREVEVILRATYKD